MGTGSLQFVRDLASDVGEAIQNACLYGDDWDDVARRINEGLPGTIVGLVGTDLRKGLVNIGASAGVDQTYVNSYAEHYALVNPWNQTWERLGNGILVSEEMLPAHRICETEFYQDWLRPLRDFDAGVGMRLNSQRQELIYLTIHYDPDQHDVYGRAIPELCRMIRRDLLSGLDFARAQAVTFDRGLTSGAIVDRLGQCAIAVTGEMKVLDANAGAMGEFESGQTIQCIRGRLCLSGQASDRLLKAAVRQTIEGKPGTDTFTFYDTGQRWVAKVIALHSRARKGLCCIIPAQNLALVLFENLSAKREVASQFAQTFHLTPAEFRMCSLLAKGFTIQQAANTLGITEGSARQRAKAIMAKTETTRQADLVGLMSRFSL